MGIFDIFSPKAGNTTQQTTTALSPQAQQFWDNLFPQLKSQQQPTSYQGSTVASVDPATTAGQNQVLGAANGDASNLAHQAALTNLFHMDPARLNVTADPNITRQADAATRYGTMSAQDSLRNVRGESTANGMFGSNSRGALREGAAYGNLATGNEKIVADLFANAYKDAANRGMQAVQGNNQVIAGSALPGTMMDAVGQQRQGQAQRELDAQIEAYYRPEMMKQAWLAQQMQLLGLMPGSTTTSTATGQNPKGSMAAGGLGGAASGAAIGSMIMPGVGTVAGGALGGLIGLLGNR